MTLSLCRLSTGMVFTDKVIVPHILKDRRSDALSLYRLQQLCDDQENLCYHKFVIWICNFLQITVCATTALNNSHHLITKKWMCIYAGNCPSKPPVYPAAFWYILAWKLTHRLQKKKIYAVASISNYSGVYKPIVRSGIATQSWQKENWCLELKIRNWSLDACPIIYNHNRENCRLWMKS